MELLGTIKDYRTDFEETVEAMSYYASQVEVCKSNIKMNDSVGLSTESERVRMEKLTRRYNMLLVKIQQGALELEKTITNHKTK